MDNGITLNQKVHAAVEKNWEWWLPAFKRIMEEGNPFVDQKDSEAALRHYIGNDRFEKRRVILKNMGR